MEEMTGEKIKDSPIEQVRLTVPTTDDERLPTLTFRTWVIGLPLCCLVTVVEAFVGYRNNPVYVNSLITTILVLLLGRLMAASLPSKHVQVPLTGWTFSMNPGPFNMKEHVVTSILATSITRPEAVTIVTLLRVFYHRHVTFWPALFLALSTEVVGFGLAGIFKKLFVDHPLMWWPSCLTIVSFFRALHEVQPRKKGKLTRWQFLIVVGTASFTYYIVPNYFFPSITMLSFVCWIWKDSVTAQQIGSGYHGLGVGSIGLDWSTISGFMGSPLAIPAFAIFNIVAGFVLLVCIIIPIAYWTNQYNAKRFPIFSSDVFDADGQPYNITRIIDPNTFQIDKEKYRNYSKLYYSIFIPYREGFVFASVVASYMHIALFDARSLWHDMKKAYTEKEGDIHNHLMKKYDAVPLWWFLTILISMTGLAILSTEGFGKQFQLPYWGVLLALVLAIMVIFPKALLLATCGTGAKFDIVLQLIFGYLLPGRPLANLSFQSYGYMTALSATQFLQDLKLSHYMKIPPKSMFIAQVSGILISSAISLSTSWYILSSVKNICHPDKLPEGSPWTCPVERVDYATTVSWGLIGPRHVYFPDGQYSAMFLFFLVGLVAPFLVWILARACPKKKWISLINFPVIFSAGGNMPPLTAVNFWSWLTIGTSFSFYVYYKHRDWWAEYNYLLGAGLDSGIALVSTLTSFTLQLHDIYGIQWWGLDLSDHCPLAICPTAPGIKVNGCPTF